MKKSILIYIRAEIVHHLIVGAIFMYVMGHFGIVIPYFVCLGISYLSYGIIDHLKGTPEHVSKDIWEYIKNEKI